MPLNLFKDKKHKKRLERWIGRQWVRLIMLATRFLTLERARRLGHIFGKLGFWCLLRHRRQALRNLRLVYGKEKSEQELQELARRSFIRASCFGWEVFYLHTHKVSDEEVEALVKKIEGLEHLKEAASRGRGIIGLGAHLGNFPVLGRRLNLLGFPSTTIMRQLRDEKLETVFAVMRTRFGQRWIPKFPLVRAVKESIDWLRTGKLLIVYVDQRSGRGAKVNFMGIPTPTPTGAAVFALKTQAAVLPIFIVLDEFGAYKLIIGAEVSVTRTGNHKEDVLVNTERFNQAIEKYIRLYPDQWFWFHNRWKGINPK